MQNFVYRYDGSWKSIINSNRLRLVSISNQHRILSVAFQGAIFTSFLLSYTLNKLSVSQVNNPGPNTGHFSSEWYQ